MCRLFLEPKDSGKHLGHYSFDIKFMLILLKKNLDFQILETFRLHSLFSFQFLGVPWIMCDNTEKGG